MFARLTLPNSEAMGFYSTYIFPRMLEWSLDNEVVRRERSEALTAANGVTLEIGFGTGLNLRHYPTAVTRVVAIDPETMLARRVSARIERAPMPVEQLHLDASGRLPFDDEYFDTVVTTFTLCSIADVDAALGEMRRVLKPTGRYLFLEHGRSNRPNVAKWQDRLNPIQKFVACGCNMNRPIDRIVTGAGFAICDIDRYVMHDTPPILGTMYRGTASRAGTG